MKKPALLSRIIALTAAIGIALATHASPLDTKGIPSDAQAIVHFDAEAFFKSKFGPVLNESIEKIASQQSSLDAASAQQFQEYLKFKNLTGIDPAKDITGVTMAFFKPTTTTQTQFSAHDAITIIRGKFTPEKLVETAKKQNYPIFQQGERTLIQISRKETKTNTSRPSPAPKIESMLICIVDDHTLILAEDKERIVQSLAVYAGKQPSYTAPAALAGASADSSTPIMAMNINQSLFSNAGENNETQFVDIQKIQTLRMLISETGENFCTSIAVEFTDADAAQQMQGSVQMALGFLQVAAAQATQKTKGATNPEALENAKRMQTLLTNLKYDADDRNINITLNYPSADLIKLIREQTAKKIESQKNKHATAPTYDNAAE